VCRYCNNGVGRHPKNTGPSDHNLAILLLPQPVPELALQAQFHSQERKGREAEEV
jgi:hypothetical protein